MLVSPNYCYNNMFLMLLLQSSFCYRNRLMRQNGCFLLNISAIKTFKFCLMKCSQISRFPARLFQFCLFAFWRIIKLAILLPFVDSLDGKQPAQQGRIITETLISKSNKVFYCRKLMIV